MILYVSQQEPTQIALVFLLQIKCAAAFTPVIDKAPGCSQQIPADHLRRKPFRQFSGHLGTPNNPEAQIPKCIIQLKASSHCCCKGILHQFKWTCTLLLNNKAEQFQNSLGMLSGMAVVADIVQQFLILPETHRLQNVGFRRKIVIKNPNRQFCPRTNILT